MFFYQMLVLKYYTPLEMGLNHFQVILTENMDRTILSGFKSNTRSSYFTEQDNEFVQLWRYAFSQDCLT